MYDIEALARDIFGEKAWRDYPAFRDALMAAAVEEGMDCSEVDAKRIASALGLTPTARPVPRRQQKKQARPSNKDLRGLKDRGGQEIRTSAPFDFIALAEKIALPEPEVREAFRMGTLHSHPLAKGYCGTLTVDWEFDGPMLIGQGRGGKNVGPQKIGNRHVIPGATIRGLLRSTLENLALGRLEQTDKHRAFAIRDFSHALFDDDQPDVSAGWLSRVPGSPDDAPKYQIKPCRWARIPIRDLPGVSNDAKGHANWLTKPMDDRYAVLGMKPGKTSIYDFSRKTPFKRTQMRRPDGYLKDVVVPASAGDPGVIVVTDQLRTFKASPQNIEELDRQDANPDMGDFKRFETVFFDTTKPAFEVPKDVWDDFISINSTQSNNKPKPVGNWALLAPTLLEAGRPIPVFYSTHGGTLDFGLARVFKRKMAFRIGDKIPAAHRADATTEPDFVSALFGMVREPDKGMSEAEIKASHKDRHLKSRLAVGFATLQTAFQESRKPVRSRASTPRPSFGPYYLGGTPYKDWHEKSSRLAGRKHYPAYKGDKAAIYDQLEKLQGSADMESFLTFLEPAGGQRLRFRGELRLHNVTEAEIGALVFALTLGGDAELRHGIGRAKAQGAGQARVARLEMALERNDGAALPSGAKDTWEAQFDGSAKRPPLAAFVEAFARHMQRVEARWPDVSPVTEYLGSCLPRAVAQRSRDYMALKNFRLLRSCAYDKGGHSAPDRLLAPPKRQAKAARHG